MRSGTRRWTVGALLVAVMAAGSVACAEPSPSGSNHPGVPKPPTVAPGTVAPSQRKVVAQSSLQDLAQALDAAGVDDSERWAKVVVAGKPYPPGAAGQEKLRQVLIADKADPDTIGKITNAVVP